MERVKPSRIAWEQALLIIRYKAWWSPPWMDDQGRSNLIGVSRSLDYRVEGLCNLGANTRFRKLVHVIVVMALSS
jgi:hypothetical protein